MKATLYDVKGKEKGTIVMPKMFDAKIREDIVLKYVEASKYFQPYRPARDAGRKHSAHGTISHKRHDWKGHYGKGISRVPRKTMWRRGTQFFWIGAGFPGARGGPEAHPPKGIGKEKRINLKEIQMAMNSGFAATANKKRIAERYSTFKDERFEAPFVVESKLENVKTKELIGMIKNLFGENHSLALKEKTVRAGKGKLRGRKYKSNAGLLLVKSSDEKIKTKRIEVKSVSEVVISDLYPLGRLTVYTEKALEELGGIKK